MPRQLRASRVALLFVIAFQHLLLCSSDMYFPKNPNYDPFGCANFGGCSNLSQYLPYMECAPGACLCPGGFTGPICETNLNEDNCASNPCGDGQECRSVPTGTFVCSCAPGYNGPDCTAEVADPCGEYASEYCFIYGCTNDASSTHGMICDCPAGRTGKNCSAAIECTVDSDCNYGGACNIEQGWCECLLSEQYPNYDYYGDLCLGYTQCSYLAGTQYECLNGGTCWQHWASPPNSSFNCACDDCHTGAYCETMILYCDSNPCENGGICSSVLCDYECACPAPYGGKSCETYAGACDSSPCENGGTCIDTNGGTSFACSCVNGYTGAACETMIDNCASLPCQNGGTCVNGLASFTCLCTEWYTGSICGQEVDFCTSSPCMNNGTCLPELGNFSCECLPNYEGATCDIYYDACAPVRTPNGVMHPSPCQVYDVDAQCMALGNGTNFTCVCSANYTDVHCNLTIQSFITLEKMFSPLPWEKIQDALADMRSDPTKFNTAILYQLASLNESERSTLSWNLEDVFDFMAFEDSELDPANVISVFNDVTLGNCFTFNYRTSNESYASRRAGDQGGLQVRLKLDQGQNLPFVILASYYVFVHNVTEDVFYDSIGQQPQPGAATRLAVTETSYEYMTTGNAKCIGSAHGITPYFYDTAHYSQQACYRSCYQQEVIDSCGCADYSYPKPDESDYCNMSRRPCVEDYKALSDMPTSWRGCAHCRPGCSFVSYVVAPSFSALSDTEAECDSSLNSTECQSLLRNFLEVTVSYTTLTIYSYVEEYTMNMTTLLSYIGGMAGVCLGLSVPFFFELVFLVATICKSQKDTDEHLAFAN